MWALNIIRKAGKGKLGFLSETFFLSFFMLTRKAFFQKAIEFVISSSRALLRICKKNDYQMRHVSNAHGQITDLFIYCTYPYLHTLNTKLVSSKAFSRYC